MEEALIKADPASQYRGGAVCDRLHASGSGCDPGGVRDSYQAMIFIRGSMALSLMPWWSSVQRGTSRWIWSPSRIACRTKDVPPEISSMEFVRELIWSGSDFCQCKILCQYRERESTAPQTDPGD